MTTSSNNLKAYYNFIKYVPSNKKWKAKLITTSADTFQNPYWGSNAFIVLFYLLSPNSLIWKIS